MTAHCLGLDLGLAQVGAARVTRDQHLTTRHLVTPPVPCIEGHQRCTEHDADIAAEARRVERVAAWAVRQASPDTMLAVIERTAYGAQQAQSGDQRSGVWWLVATALVRHGVPLAVVANNTSKKYLTGSGRASKADVHAAVLACYPRRPRRPELRAMAQDEADAAALAILGADWAGWPGPYLDGRRGSGWARAGVWPRREDVRA